MASTNKSGAKPTSAAGKKDTSSKGGPTASTMTKHGSQASEVADRNNIVVRENIEQDPDDLER